MKFYGLFLFIFLFVCAAQAQNMRREFPLKIGGAIDIENLYGRVSVAAQETEDSKVFVSIESAQAIKETEVETKAENGKVTIFVKPQNSNSRIDLIIKVPLRSRVSVETGDGEVAIAGNLEKVNVTTDTGTISTDVPTEDIRYNFIWTRSRPRFLSDFTLEEVSEKSAGRFGLSGRFGESLKEKEKRLKKEGQSKTAEIKSEETSENSENSEETEKESKSDKRKREILAATRVELNFTTGRGIILVNVPPGDVPADLSERKLTEAAKAVVRSGDSLLTEAIRRASPKFFGDYAKTLPPRRLSPTLTDKPQDRNAAAASVKQTIARVMDANNRAVGNLKKEDFTLTEAGSEREILSVVPTSAPFNIVLLLDVSGSIDNYVNFIRKAARQFINTTSPRDKITIITFSDDVKQISTFTTDKRTLSESLDTFDAGGATAYYDALAYALVDTLKPLRGERTAIIALSDGDDNRSFLPFESLLGSVQESGALIYPLYVPSTLVAASATRNPESTIDPLRTRYMGLTSKAESEGAKLAQVSGGVYYPIQRLSDLQKAYDDIVEQLRTAYIVTYRSDETSTGNPDSPRLRIKVNRENTFVYTGAITPVSPQSSLSGNDKNYFSINFQKTAFQFSNALNYSPFNLFAHFQQPEEISGNVEKIKYKQFVADELREYKFENFDVNAATGNFLLDNGREKIAVSRWISPKRTRSYPYERVYNTLAHSGVKVAIIPVVKDEGMGGERDFLQWDTISLLSLLDVRIVLAYYDDAEKNAKRADQITAQKFDNNYIVSRLNEVFEFKGTSREWNERETKQLKSVLEKAKAAYQQISKKTGTYLHDSAALDSLINYAETPVKFLEFSRGKSQKAQSREFNTDQPKEALASDTKAKVTINNALFGKYYFTCDETKIEGSTISLIEAKHSQRSKLPSENDIKDGLVKMMLYTNLTGVKVGANPFSHKVAIRLTSAKLDGAIQSTASNEELAEFCAKNALNKKQQEFLQKLFQEARENNFTIILEKGETEK